MAVAALVGLLILLGARRMCTVFAAKPLSPDGAAPPAPTAEQPVAALATAKFPAALPGGGVKRIVGRDVTVQIVPAEADQGRRNGHLMLCPIVANGVRLMCQMHFPPGTKSETGAIFRGTSPSPTLRLDGPDGEVFLRFQQASQALAVQAALAGG
jgi:hypothetical protein